MLKNKGFFLRNRAGAVSFQARWLVRLTMTIPELKHVFWIAGTFLSSGGTLQSLTNTKAGILTGGRTGDFWLRPHSSTITAVSLDTDAQIKLAETSSITELARMQIASPQDELHDLSYQNEIS